MQYEISEVEATNRQRVRGWLDLAGVEANFPIDTATACRVLQAIDYLADCDTALAFVQADVIPPVAGENGRLEWTATNLVAFASALEMRRKWKPFSQLHANKFTATEKLIHVCEHSGESAFSDLAEYDIDALLALIVQVAGSPGLVQTLVEALRHKMKLEAVL